jgi:hypothetical protein
LAAHSCQKHHSPCFAAHGVRATTLPGLEP